MMEHVRWSVSGPQRLARGRVTALFVLFGYGDVFVAVMGPDGGAFCIALRILHLRILLSFMFCKTCGGFFSCIWVVCLGDSSLSDFYQCFFGSVVYR